MKAEGESREWAVPLQKQWHRQQLVVAFMWQWPLISSVTLSKSLSLQFHSNRHWCGMPASQALASLAPRLISPGVPCTHRVLVGCVASAALVKICFLAFPSSWKLPTSLGPSPFLHLQSQQCLTSPCLSSIALSSRVFCLCLPGLNLIIPNDLPILKSADRNLSSPLPCNLI